MQGLGNLEFNASVKVSIAECNSRHLNTTNANNVLTQAGNQCRNEGLPKPERSRVGLRKGVR